MGNVKNIRALATLLFALMFLKFAIQAEKFDFSKNNMREIASVKSKNTICINSLNKLINRSKSSLEVLKKIPSKLKIGLYSNLVEITEAYPQNKYFQNKFLDTLNSASEKGVLSTPEIELILQNIKNKKFIKRVSNNKKVTWHIATPIYVNKNLSRLYKKLENNYLWDKSKINSLKKLIDNLDLRYEQKRFDEIYNKLSTNLKDIPSQKNIEEVLDFLHFLSFQSKNQVYYAMINDLSFLNKSTHTNSKLVKRFKKLQARTIKFKDSKFKQIYKSNLLKENISDSKAKLLARRDSKDLTAKYKRLQHACYSKRATPEKQVSSKSFVRFTTGLGFLSASSSYAYAHWDKEKDQKWFEKFGYEVGVVVSYYWVMSKILSRSDNTFSQQLLKAYLVDIAIGGVNAKTYAYLFGTSREEAEKRLQEMYSDPNFKNRVSDLEERFKDITDQELLAKELSNLLPNNSTITPTDIENEDNLKELLINSILLEEYKINEGKLIVTGDTAKDRFVFDRIWNLVAIPRYMFFQYLILKNLCINQDKPFVAYSKALAIYSFERVIFDPIYYTLRNYSIGQ